MSAPLECHGCCVTGHQKKIPPVPWFLPDWRSIVRGPFVRTVFPVAIFLLLTAACSSRTGDDGRESIHDRVVHLEDELHLDVPDVPRWCDQLDLVKQKVDVGDCDLYVEEEGRGMPLVLINGGPGGTHHDFHPWFSRAADFARVIYYDQRGCGLSDWEPGEGYSVDQAIEDLDRIREFLGYEQWVVLGYSYGGFLAQWYTVNYPDRVAGLVLLGASTGMWNEGGGGRQYDFISDEEQEKIREISSRLRELRTEHNWSYNDYMRLIVYNNHLNGDWKRQNFYRPSRDDIARLALYEWNHDSEFRGPVSATQNRIDLTGAFESCPIPTLILEGQWDLTWSTGKPEILLGNHPGAELVMFKNAGHGIYSEETDRFFRVLRRFVKQLPSVDDSDISAWKTRLEGWDRDRTSSPRYVLRGNDWGRKANEELVAIYSREWLASFDETGEFLKIGFALYDLKEYVEALEVFGRMEGIAEAEGNDAYRCMAIIWQGHMLDLLGRRSEAVTLYQQAADMQIDDQWMHSQFEMSYTLSPWAAERVKDPFTRVENRQK